ncbi:hypothetical protein E2562_031843 [Oryza meyeriana var. granulata]|uniref:Uncharacterized protein n=1 Tax=Oryza meyeriana var. granulata TaxID=110450 RepID=A0A6G1CVG8_9ORYZ|nr:hypothetical protein E2562_031843 [Oryza meyeriana var. granulata]
MTRCVVGPQEVFDVVLAAPEAVRGLGEPESGPLGVWDGAGETPAPLPHRESKAAASGSASGDAVRSRRREAMVESAEAGSGDRERSRMGVAGVGIGRGTIFFFEGQGLIERSTKNI